MGVYYVLVLTRGAMEPWSCTPYWCSSGEPGNKASPRIVHYIGAHQRSLRTRLALELYTLNWCSPGEPGVRLAKGLYSVLVLTRAAWEQGYHWACTPYWRSPISFGDP